ncbi:TorF family putative porin [Caenimonas terrae]|uniref:TorF family putative porin n=1 Tax=Caenimonas terrae TaxID=696074 RepID=A0ABW0NIH7_9BURK
MRSLQALARDGSVAACVAGGLLLSSPARAQLGGSISVDSDYRFRGVSLSGAKPTVRLSANIDAASGWYGGGSATQARLARGERYLQSLGYAGHVTPLAAGRSFDVGASYSHFAGERRFDFAEAYAGLQGERWSLRLNYSPDYFGQHTQTAYLDASVDEQLGDVARLFGHVGLLLPLAGTEPGNAGTRRARVDLRAGAGWRLRDIDLQVAWTVASRGGPVPAAYDGRRSALVFSASYSF